MEASYGGGQGQEGAVVPHMEMEYEASNMCNVLCKVT